MIRTFALLLCLSTPAFAQQIDVNHAIAPFQEQRNTALDTAAFCSINLDAMKSAISDLQKKLAEAEAKIAELQK